MIAQTLAFTRYALLCLLCLAGPSHAEVLPLGHGMHSAAFVMDSKVARLPVGTRVEFTAKNRAGYPKAIFIQGYVLGARNGVVFFELSERDAARLAIARAKHVVGYRKIADPVA